MQLELTKNEVLPLITIGGTLAVLLFLCNKNAIKDAIKVLHFYTTPVDRGRYGVYIRIDRVV